MPWRMPMRPIRALAKRSAVVQSGELVAAGTGIEAEAKAEANADLEQIADQGNENSQTATPTVAFTAAPTFGTDHAAG